MQMNELWLKKKTLVDILGYLYCTQLNRLCTYRVCFTFNLNYVNAERQAAQHKWLQVTIHMLCVCPIHLIPEYSHVQTIMGATWGKNFVHVSFH